MSPPAIMRANDLGSVDTASRAQVFDLLDVNNDGVLTKSELSNLADAHFAVGVVPIPIAWMGRGIGYRQKMRPARPRPYISHKV
jgi:hypothetical protein